MVYKISGSFTHNCWKIIGLSFYNCLGNELGKVTCCINLPNHYEVLLDSSDLKFGSDVITVLLSHGRNLIYDYVLNSQQTVDDYWRRDFGQI